MSTPFTDPGLTPGFTSQVPDYQPLPVQSASGVAGTVTLVGGTATVALPGLRLGHQIVLGFVTPAGTPGALFVSAVTPTGFTITSTSATDTSTVTYQVD